MALILNSADACRIPHKRKGLSSRMRYPGGGSLTSLHTVFYRKCLRPGDRAATKSINRMNSDASPLLGLKCTTKGLVLELGLLTPSTGNRFQYF